MLFAGSHCSRISIQLVMMLSLAWRLLAQTWNYTSSGADWIGNGCDDFYNQYQSPIDIEYASCECNEKMSFEINFGSSKSVSSTLSFSGNPKTPSISLSPEFAHLYFRTSQERSRLYTSNSMVLRTPSEHLLNGVRLPLELQIYFKSIYEENLALSLLFTNSTKNMSNIIVKDIITAINTGDAMIAYTAKKTVNFTNYINFNKVFDDRSDFFYYNGSRTDTDCQTPVKWIILSQPLSTNSSDVESLVTLLKNVTKVENNTRMEQELRNRIIYVSSDSCSDFFTNVIWLGFLYASVILIVFKTL